MTMAVTLQNLVEDVQELQAAVAILIRKSGEGSKPVKAAGQADSYKKPTKKKVKKK